jgi:hypothetical protein
MQAWSTYFSTIGTAAATLLGLLFVAVSVNAAAALGAHDRLTRDIAEQAFQNYLAVMLVALLALFPNLQTWIFGPICLLAAGARAAWLALRLGRTFQHSEGRRNLIAALRRHLSTVIGYGLLILATVRMTLNWGDNFNTLAASTMVLMFSATTASWELLRRIAVRAAP